jgi:hypothetical protein
LGLKEPANLDDLILAEIASATGAEGKYLAVHGDGPVAIVRFMHPTKALQQDAHVLPLDVVIEWMSEDLLDGNSVVVIQLD